MTATRLISALLIIAAYFCSPYSIGANTQNAFSEFENKVWELVYNRNSLSNDEIYTALSQLQNGSKGLIPEQQALLLLHQCRLAARTQQPLASLVEQAKALETYPLYQQGAAAKYRCEQERALLAENYAQYAELGHLAFVSLNQHDLPALQIWIAYDYIEQALEAGYYDNAIAAAELSLRLAQANQLTDWQAETLGGLALIQSAIGNSEQALETNQQALNLTSDAKIQLELTVNRAYILTEANQFQAARSLYEEALTKALPDYPNYYLIAGPNLIGIYITLNDFAAINTLLPTLSSMAMAEQDSFLLAYINVARAAEALLNAQPELADKHFAQAKQWFTENQVLEPLASILNRWAFLLHLQNRHSEAYQALNESISIKSAVDMAKRTENALLHNAMLSAEQQKRELLQVKQQHQHDQALLMQKKLEQQLTLTLLAAVLLLASISFYAYWRLKSANKQLAEKNLQLDYESTHDPLTKVFNRRYFSDFITPKLQSKREALLLLLDIDHFKKVNDSYGHQAGDEVLKIVSQRLSNKLREGDCIIRWGGEEFLIFIDNPVNEQQCALIIKRLLQEIASTPVTLPEHEITVTISIGFSVVTLASLPELEQQLDAIDSLLYHAKKNGRNQAAGCWEKGKAINVLLQTH